MVGVPKSRVKNPRELLRAAGSSLQSGKLLDDPVTTAVRGPRVTLPQKKTNTRVLHSAMGAREPRTSAG